MDRNPPPLRSLGLLTVPPPPAHHHLLFRRHLRLQDLILLMRPQPGGGTTGCVDAVESLTVVAIKYQVYTLFGRVPLIELGVYKLGGPILLNNTNYSCAHLLRPSSRPGSEAKDAPTCYSMISPVRSMRCDHANLYIHGRTYGTYSPEK